MARRVTIASLLAAIGCLACRGDAPAGARVDADVLDAVSAGEVLRWTRAAAPEATFARAGSERETAAVLQHAVRALERSFHGRGLAAPDDDRVAEYVLEVYRDRVRRLALRVEARARAVHVGDEEVAALASQMRAHIAIDGADLVPDEEELLRRSRETLTIERLLAPELEPTARDLEDWLSEHRDAFTFANGALVVEIRIHAAPDPAARAEALRRATAVQGRLGGLGGDEVRSSAEPLGDAPDLELPKWIDLDRVPSAIHAAVEATAVGGTTPPIEGPPGYAVIRVLARRKDAAPPFAEIRAQVREHWRDAHRDAVLGLAARRAFERHDVRLVAP